MEEGKRLLLSVCCSDLENQLTQLGEHWLCSTTKVNKELHRFDSTLKHWSRSEERGRGEGEGRRERRVKRGRGEGVGERRRVGFVYSFCEVIGGIDTVYHRSCHCVVFLCCIFYC